MLIEQRHLSFYFIFILYFYLSAFEAQYAFCHLEEHRGHDNQNAKCRFGLGPIEYSTNYRTYNKNDIHYLTYDKYLASLFCFCDFFLFHSILLMAMMRYVCIYVTCFVMPKNASDIEGNKAYMRSILQQTLVSLQKA